MIKESNLKQYAVQLAKQAEHYTVSNKLQHVALLQVLAFFAPCSPDDSENLFMTSETIKKMAGSLVSLKVNDISAIMLAAGFSISVNSERIAAWNIRPLTSPINFEVNYN